MSTTIKVRPMMVTERSLAKVLSLRVSFIGLFTAFLQYWPQLQEYIVQYVPAPWGQLAVIVISGIVSAVMLFTNAQKTVVSDPNY